MDNSYPATVAQQTTRFSGGRMEGPKGPAIPLVRDQYACIQKEMENLRNIVEHISNKLHGASPTPPSSMKERDVDREDVTGFFEYINYENQSILNHLNILASKLTFINEQI